MPSQDQLSQRLSQAFEVKQAELLAEVIHDAYTELVKTSDFSELKLIVRELGQAQARTEQRVGELVQAQARTEQRVEELAQAQARTEQRVEELAQVQARTERRVEELAQAQTRTERRVEELAQVQARTEHNLSQLTERVDRLTEAQARTEHNLSQLTERVDRLTEAQTRTEHNLSQLTERVDRLTEAMDDTRKQLGGLAMTVGYTLENAAYKVLPTLLQEDFGLLVQNRLKRDYVTDTQGRTFEVNIFGDAIQGEESVKIIGESKSQLSIPDINRFIKRRLEPLRAVFAQVFPLVITHMTSGPDVEAYAKEQGIALYYSYEF